MVEVGAMVDAGLVGWRTTEDLWLPGIQVRVEVDDSDRAVRTVHGAEERKSDGVVAAEGDDTGQSLAVLAWAWRAKRARLAIVCSRSLVLLIPGALAFVWGSRMRMLLWPSSICMMAYALS